MKIYLYDGSFEGLMCVFVEYFKHRPDVFDVQNFEKFGADIFADYQDVICDADLAERVMQRLKIKLKSEILKSFYHVFLSEDEKREYHILRMLAKCLDFGVKMLSNSADEDSLYLSKMYKSVHREKHRMEAFVRFRQMKDGLYAAVVEPDFNVLPIISDHFEERYADQFWLIYDARRKFGIYYNQRDVKGVEIEFDFEAFKTETSWDENEQLFQTLWKNYFRSTNIISRKNSKLHVQHMPKRYWKYLVEKERL